MNALNILKQCPNLSFVAAVAFAVALANPNCGFAGSWTVTSLADSGPGSLRAAITSAIGGDSIDFAVTGTITNLSGELFINKDLKLVGPGAEKLAISGNDSNRVFRVQTGVTVSLSALTICDGHAKDGADCTGRIFPAKLGADGGGIHNAGTLALTNCVVARCRSGDGGDGYITSYYTSNTGGNTSAAMGGNGGGIYNSGSLTMARCSMQSNRSGNGGSGGRIVEYALSDAAGAGSGGAIYTTGTTLLVGCTVSSNSAGMGGAGTGGGTGGLDSQMDGTPGTLGGNGGSGGGIHSSGSLTLVSCTIAGNLAGAGGAGGPGGDGRPSSSASGNGAMGADGGAGGSGGGLYCVGPLQATACTIVKNSSGTGGGGGKGGRGGSPIIIQASGGNGGNGGNGGAGGSGGGIVSEGTLPDMQNVLVGENSAASQGFGGAGGSAVGGGYKGSPGVSGLPGLGPDLYGAFNSKGHNFVGRGEDCSGFSDAIGDIVGQGTPLDPLICSLADNGGPTFTIALRQGSPAIDAGDDTLMESPLSLINDQRGYARKSGAHVDIGAYELHRATGKIEMAASRVTSGPGIQLTLTNVPGASLTMLCATNPNQPLIEWIELGGFREIAPGQFQFSETPQAEAPPRFYRVRCP